MTEFFEEVISLSVSHIYHSALLLAPPSSIIQKLYSQCIYSPMVRVVTGIPASWDSCTASIGGNPPYCIDWSPCGQFIAAGFGQSIEILDSGTLGRVSTFGPPCDMLDFFPVSHPLAWWTPAGLFLLLLVVRDPFHQDFYICMSILICYLGGV